MKIHFYDDDPRLKIEGLAAYSQNCGSFANISNNINIELAKRGLLGTEHDSEIMGFASGLKWDFGFYTRKRFLINVWETNVLPSYLVKARSQLECDKYKVFGLSEQISNVWRSYGFPTETVDIGCDADFWAPQKDIAKYNKFTIVCTVCCNFRSGVTNLIHAFAKAAKEDPNIKLIIKNTDERAVKIPILVDHLKKQGLDIEYICSRWTLKETRELMAKCHLMVYPVLNTSAGLPILEASAMELPILVGDFCPVNIYPVCDTVKVHDMSIKQAKPILCDVGGLPYTFPEGWIDEEKAMLHWVDINDLSGKILKVKWNYELYSKKAVECRQEVINNWSWKHSCDQLLKHIL